MIWANYFGRISLGKIRGMGSLLTSVFSAGGPPCFGLLFDYTQSYILSFSIFIGLLFASAFLSLFLHPPKKGRGLWAYQGKNVQSQRDDGEQRSGIETLESEKN